MHVHLYQCVCWYCRNLLTVAYYRLLYCSGMSCWGKRSVALPQLAVQASNGTTPIRFLGPKPKSCRRTKDLNTCHLSYQQAIPDDWNKFADQLRMKVNAKLNSEY